MYSLINLLPPRPIPDPAASSLSLLPAVASRGLFRTCRVAVWGWSCGMAGLAVLRCCSGFVVEGALRVVLACVQWVAVAAWHGPTVLRWCHRVLHPVLAGVASHGHGRRAGVVGHAVLRSGNCVAIVSQWDLKQQLASQCWPALYYRLLQQQACVTGSCAVSGWIMHAVAWQRWQQTSAWQRLELVATGLRAANGGGGDCKA
ncbi:hypothetical protein EDB89DRAFT_1907752 [Lactarius sanguifluus]|nr:hypothetical protein EDB89DRAFT_1907752 [Lactarius sanguifluus]